MLLFNGLITNAFVAKKLVAKPVTNSKVELSKTLLAVLSIAINFKIDTTTMQRLIIPFRIISLVVFLKR